MRGRTGPGSSGSRVAAGVTPDQLASMRTLPSWPNRVAALPGARVVTLAGQGHVAMLTAPELFTAEVFAFLRRST